MSRPMMWNHWVARATTPYQPFQDFELARWSWLLLEKHFPNKVSAVLMPNHLHLILPKEKNNSVTLRKLSGLLGAITRRTKKKNLWQSVPEPATIPDRFHLKRQVRYVALNPCRKSLCEDPLEWFWSSYREIFGATYRKIQQSGRLAHLLGEVEKDFEVRFHAYVSGDPSVNVSGTSPPRPAIPTGFATRPIFDILNASAGALLLPPNLVMTRSQLRPLFVHLAIRHGWKQTALLAKLCGTSARAIQLILSKKAPLSLTAAEICLGDQRLRAKMSSKDFKSMVGLLD